MLRAFGLIAALAVGCAHAPTSPDAQARLRQRADAALQNMEASNTHIRPTIDQAAGYVVFPSAWDVSFFGGGAGGTGIVYQHGQAIGYAELNQGSFGAEAGAQKFSEVIVVRDLATLDQMRRGKFDIGANASAVISSAGTGKATAFGANGIAVFVQPLAGAEVKASLVGQNIKVIF